MVSDVLTSKAATVERCVARIWEDYDAVHDYASLNLAIVVSIVERHLSDFPATLLKSQ